MTNCHVISFVCLARGFQVLPVAPPHVRPSVSFDGVNRGDDDLTYKYVDIVKANNALMGTKRSGQTDIKIQVLHHHATLVACCCCAVTTFCSAVRRSVE